MSPSSRPASTTWLRGLLLAAVVGLSVGRLAWLEREEAGRTEARAVAQADLLAKLLQYHLREGRWDEAGRELVLYTQAGGWRWAYLVDGRGVPRLRAPLSGAAASPGPASLPASGAGMPAAGAASQDGSLRVVSLLTLPDGQARPAYLYLERDLAPERAAARQRWWLEAASLAGLGILGWLYISLVWRRRVDRLASEPLPSAEGEAASVGAAGEDAVARLAHRVNRLRAALLARAEAAREQDCLLDLTQKVGQLGSWEDDRRRGRWQGSWQLSRLLGRDPAAPIASREAYLACVHPDDRRKLNHVWLASLESGAPAEATFRVRLPDGGEKQLLSRWQYFLDKRGGAWRGLGIDQDISERHGVEQALREERNFIAAVLDVLGALVIVIARDGRIERFNAACERCSGFRAQEVIGRVVWEVLIPEAARDDVRMVFQRLAAGMFPSTHVNAWLTRDGGERLISWSNSCLVDAGGRVSHVIATGLDITDQRRLEHEKEQLSKQLRHAQRMESIGQLTGGLAHDFNNILTAIMGYNALTLGRFGDQLPAQAVTYLQEVERAGERARDLVKKMLAFARGSQGEERVFDPRMVLTEVVEMLRGSLPSSIDLRVHDDGEVGQVRMDPVLLHQMLTNLVINARDALAGKGRIDIGVRRSLVPDLNCGGCQETVRGEYIEICVRDDGCGIPPELLDKIFFPFFTTKEVGKGSGLGLAMVMGGVHQYGGHVTVDSAPGQGASFHLWLPPHAETGESPVARVTEAAPGEGQGLRVLVVDDEPALVQLLTAFLGHHGYRVTGFSDPRQALAAFRAAPQEHDLVLTDQTMPGLTGLELTAAIHALRPEVPVVLCSGYSDDLSSMVLGTAGVQYFFSKPLNLPLLGQKLRELWLGQRGHDAGEGDAHA